MTSEEFIQSIALEGEEWRDVGGWEGLYYISSFGRVFCAKQSTHKPTIIKPYLVKRRKKTYQAVKLNLAPIREHWLVHRLVAFAFIPNPYQYPIVNHKDEDPSNNNTDNLEWCTQQYNTNYGTHNARMAHTISTTAYQKREVVQLSTSNTLIAQYSSIKEAAESTGVNRGSISACCTKRYQTGGGYIWMYLSDYESLNQ